MNEKEILFFIKHFTNHGPDVIDCFSNGNCYWFARILAQRFHGSVYYNPKENHFCARINDNLYDITGKIKSSYFPNYNDNMIWFKSPYFPQDNSSDENKEIDWIPWKYYRYTDSSHSRRIRRDCIDLLT